MVLREASIHVHVGSSLVVPVVIEGLPERIVALGETWERKREFHLTAVAARVLEPVIGDSAAGWDTVVRVASNRSLGPMESYDRFARLEHDGLRTLIVMVRAPGLPRFYAQLSDALGSTLMPPPAHVTLYSSDPAEGIGIVDRTELSARGRLLSGAEQAEVRRAIGVAL